VRPLEMLLYYYYFIGPNMNLHYFTFACPLLYTYKFVIGPYTLKLNVNNFSNTFHSFDSECKQLE
jgi:hypothetical protein